MAFRPKPQDRIEIEGKGYSFSEHPSAPNMAYGQTGRRATVYQVRGEDNRLHALKVFTTAWRDSRNAVSAEQLQGFARLPGLQVCQRLVIRPEKHGSLIRVYPEMEYAVLMEWVSGETWQEVMLNGKPMSVEQSREVGLAFVNILKQMEHKHLAHCDLSGPNVMLQLDPARVALVDVEDLYGPGLVRPERVGGGSSGYAHKTAPRGLWRADADRFAGAILLAEMLGWSDERVRRIAYGEQYFDLGEVQEGGERYQVLMEVLKERWGKAVAEAFARVWYSEQVEECPSFQEWEGLLNPVDLDRVQAKLAVAERLLGEDRLDEAIGELEGVYLGAPEMVSGAYARALMTRGAARERGKDLDGSLLDYRLALEVVPEGGLKDELKLITDELETKTKKTGSALTSTGWVDSNSKIEGSETDPSGSSVTTDDELAGDDTPQNDPVDTDRLQPERKRRKRAWIIVGILLSVIVLCLLTALIFPQIFPGFLGLQGYTETTVPIENPTQPIAPKVNNTIGATTLPTQIRATSTKSSVPTEVKKTPTTPSTKTPDIAVLETCKSDTRSLCIFFFAEASKSLVVTLKQEDNFAGNYGMRINSSQYTCKVSIDNPKRMWCTGPMQPTNASLPAEIYSYPPDTLIASGNVVIPPIFYP